MSKWQGIRSADARQESQGDTAAASGEFSIPASEITQARTAIEFAVAGLRLSEDEWINSKKITGLKNDYLPDDPRRELALSVALWLRRWSNGDGANSISDFRLGRATSRLGVVVALREDRPA